MGIRLGEPSDANITDQVDGFYISALSNGDRKHDLIPISDENYFSAITLSPQPAKASSSSSPARLFCKICMEFVPAAEAFQTSSACPHVFCRVCLTRYLNTGIQENISIIRCSEENCKAVLEPEMCQELLPSEVFERWESTLCESMVLGEQEFIHDGDKTMISSECPGCKRLFCATCKAALDSGLSRKELGKLGEEKGGNEDLLMMKMAKENEGSCSSCKYFGETSDGCLHITCWYLTY